MNDTILTVHNLSRYFSGVKALDDVSFSIQRGEIHAICGENGAGKSTLIKLLTGANVPTRGAIEFENTRYTRLNPRQAMDLGIAVIYQEFSLIPYLTVAENIFFGREDTTLGIRNIKKMNEGAQKLCDDMGVKIDVTARICDLGVAYQQIVEILKAVSRQANFIIMDEPTAPLTVNEIKIFFDIIKRLKAAKVTILYISHRLEEVFDICDRVTVLCDGKYITTQDVSDINRKQLISFMVGRELAENYPVPAFSPLEVIFEAKNLTNSRVRGASFTLHRGEILGFGGLVGAGRTELARIIFGADKINTGEMLFHGKPYNPSSPHDALAGGIGLIPEDRKNQGLILGLSVKNNIIYSSLKAHSNYFIVDKIKEQKTVDEHIKGLNIRTPSPGQIINNLSGGNQQKVVLAKTLAAHCDVLILDEPTRGIDVEAKQEIYQLMNKFIETGKSVIMISSEMPELIGMSHRILVMSGGKICGELQRNEFSQELILEIASSNLFKEGA